MRRDFITKIPSSFYKGWGMGRALVTDYLTVAGPENFRPDNCFWERLILQLHQADIKSTLVSWAFRTNDIILGLWFLLLIVGNSSYLCILCQTNSKRVEPLVRQIYSRVLGFANGIHSEAIPKVFCRRKKDYEFL
ncbi:hypothetical protein HJG60_009872 [Phyllostomus discolor]|uniref:Uncharacterized protein n=1 Tax=Phyllostomus discolor TaxID=89673 RepID=A0A834B9T3_9CHIR|nr:hypothetical protein HJG60_009872 [Phyllostomus discolor]